MGQKTNPLGFRLGITQDHKSSWYAKFINYSEFLNEDDKIRSYLSKFTKVAKIAMIRIGRSGDGNQIELNIETAKPTELLGNKGLWVTNLLIDLKKLLPNNRQITVNFSEVEKSDSNAALIADWIVTQLEERIVFRRIIREAMQNARTNLSGGIKIQISGRINGAEIARREWKREGRVPLQTMRANIDYATREAHTIYGILGVKVWVYKNSN
jgi:small subunit ribosomal protein S3